MGRAVGQVPSTLSCTSHFGFQFVIQVPGAVLGGIKSTVATLMRSSHDGDDDHIGTGGAGGVGLWGTKHAAVMEDEGLDALEDKDEAMEGERTHDLPQV